MTMTALSAAKRPSNKTLLSGKGSSSEGMASTHASTLSTGTGVSFSKTISSADAFLDIVPEEMSFERLEEALSLLQKANMMLVLENEVFEQKLARESADLLTGMGAVLEKQAKRAAKLAAATAALSAGTTPASVPEKSSSVEGAAVQGGRSRVVLSASLDTSATTSSNSRLASLRGSKAERVVKMSFSQRIDIAEEAASAASERARSLRVQGEEAVADLRARHEVAHAQLADVRTARHNLEAIVVHARGNDTGDGSARIGRASAEKFNRYMTDCIKSAEANVERFRFKISTLRGHHRRVKANIATKRELGDALHPIDFDKIRIEIEEYNRKIKNKNQHLVDLKNISGGATSRLLATKRRLAEYSAQLDSIRKSTATKRSQIAALEREEHKVLEDVGRADLALNAIRVRMERHSAPDVLVYVNLKKDLDTLRRGVITWERRSRMQLQTARDLRRALRVLDRTPDAHRAHRADRTMVDDDRGSATDASGRRSPPTSAARRRQTRRASSRSRSRISEDGHRGGRSRSSASSADTSRSA